MGYSVFIIKPIYSLTIIKLYGENTVLFIQHSQAIFSDKKLIII